MIVRYAHLSDDKTLLRLKLQKNITENMAEITIRNSCE